MKKLFGCLVALFSMAHGTFASEANLIVPDFKGDLFSYNLLKIGILIAVIGAVFGLIEFFRIKKIKVHPAM